MTARPPASVIVYGFAGLIPFAAPPVLSLLIPAHQPFFAAVLLWWGAIILSFLGGARWGAAVQAPAPDALLIGQTMLPSIIAWGVLLAPIDQRGQLLLLVAAFAVMLVWDRRSGGLPGWYGWLRQWLTLLACAGLLAQAAIS